MSSNTLRNIVPTEDNPKKCQRTGCRAWKRRNSNYCCIQHEEQSGIKRGRLFRTTSLNARASDRTLARKRNKMASIRSLYSEALGDHLSNLFEQVGKDEDERLNLSAEVDLSRVTLIETQRAMAAVLGKIDAKASSKVVALNTMRAAIQHHVGIVQSYMSVAERASIATPERMRLYFETLKANLVDQLVDEDGDKESQELFDKVWTAIEATEVPKSDNKPTINVQIL